MYLLMEIESVLQKHTSSELICPNTHITLFQQTSLTV